MELVNFALYHDAQPQKVEKKKPVEEKEVTCEWNLGGVRGSQ